MFTYIHRWTIPVSIESEFISDWTYLTKEVAGNFNTVRASLSRSQSGMFVSIVQWPSIDAWEKWKIQYKNHPMRIRYRNYKVCESECLTNVVTLAS